MSSDLTLTPIRAILTDIEGTTTDIHFVHRILFPYARAHLADYVRTHDQDPAVRAALKETAELAGCENDLPILIDALIGWIDEDRKAKPLKDLQGLIWRHGYESGEFTGHLYQDVVPALAQWRDQGIQRFVYSSGSVPAQKLLFGYSDEGDITPFFDGFFDTRVGAKREVESYKTIAKSIAIPEAEVLFLSDVTAELDAARSAGMQTVQLVRTPDIATGDHPRVSNFTELLPRTFRP